MDNRLYTNKIISKLSGRTYNPDEADIYVVPYPHIGHCMKTPGYTLHCKQLDSYNARNDINYNITKNVFDNLKYYENNSNTSNKNVIYFYYQIMIY